MKKYLIPAAVFLVLAVVFKFILVGYSFLGYCFAGAALVVLAYMALKMAEPRHQKAARRLRRLMTAGLALFLAALIITEAFILHETRKAGGEPGTGYAVVLGAGVNGTVPSLSLRVRLEVALRFAEENPESVLILSGGQGPGESVTEAQCMFDWLTVRGVDPDRLILEDRAESTEENLAFSKAILEETDPDCGSVTIITAGYHILRAKLMAEDAGFENVSARPATTGWPLLELNYYLREAVAIWFYLLTR